MKQPDLERWVAGYRVAVHHPEVSGMEHLQLFQIRSKLATVMQKLSPTQQEQVRQADQVLLANADEFLQAIAEIADLASWRVQGNVPPEHWWWYLDVIARLPANLILATDRVRVAEPVVA